MERIVSSTNPLNTGLATPPQGLPGVGVTGGFLLIVSEAAGVKLWLMEIAGMVAEAGREGFGGFTGPRVSDKEEAALAQLRTALGL